MSTLAIFRLAFPENGYSNKVPPTDSFVGGNVRETGQALEVDELALGSKTRRRKGE